MVGPLFKMAWSSAKLETWCLGFDLAGVRSKKWLCRSNALHRENPKFRQSLHSMKKQVPHNRLQRPTVSFRA
jgi:hypothetical protein